MTASLPAMGLMCVLLVAPVASTWAGDDEAARTLPPDLSFGPSLGSRPNGIVLQRVPAPDTDTIRLAVSKASIDRIEDLGGRERLVRLDRFGRKLDHELRAALADTRALVLDLRSNRGGNLQRMLRAAARLTGPVHDALTLTSNEDTRPLAIPAPQGAVWQGPITVLVGTNTRSSGEVLAALLRRHAGAKVLGERTFGKDYVLRVEPISQEWRALIPSSRIKVPGEDLAGGLIPDGPIPVALASRFSIN
ncbi:MAG: S41 family peptidase [Pseudomonadota bacterium]